MLVWAENPPSNPPSLWQRKTKEEEEMASMIYLIPELCTLTGLTDQMKADFKVMKDVAQFTRITPTQRQEVIYLISQCPVLEPSVQFTIMAIGSLISYCII